jgi:hypothetical protein
MDILYEEEGELNAITFDATLRVLITHSATVTDHPVERGASISDHSRPSPDTITAECFVTTHPIQAPAIQAPAGLTASVRALSIKAKERTLTKGAQGNGPEAAEYQVKRVDKQAQTLQFSEAFDRLLSVRESLARLNANGLECLLVTSLGDFEQVLVTRVTAPKETAGKVVFTVDFKRVTFVDSEVVPVEPLETRAERERRLGARGTEEATAEEDISLAAATFEFATGSRLLRPARRDGHGGYTR